MGFAGNLRTLSLAEVFQTLNRIQATGVLRIAREEGAREIVFGQGEIIAVAVRAGAERQALLRRLILDGKLDAEASAAISSSGHESQVVQALYDRGLVSAEDLAEAVERQALDELYDIATWDHGDFVFHDAGPDAPEAATAVDRARSRPLAININSLLMEAARRQDEFNRISGLLPADDAVLGPAAGAENRLKTFRDYPYSAVVPLIDAVRCLEDLVEDSVATRLDVYTVVAALFQKELLAILSREDVIYHADYLLSQSDFPRAARLFRRALAIKADDPDTAGKLASCVAALGDVPEAAANYGQLALGRLAAGESDKAVEFAGKAVDLSPDDLRLRLVMVRCLVAAGDPEAAVEELRRVADHQLASGQLDEARGTFLKIIELRPDDEPARRELARIFSSAGGDAESEDVVVCVSCGHVNHREAGTCEACKSPLHLSCLSCGRVVAASDRLCIFCGADPHGGQGRRRAAAGSPATSRIVNPSRVRQAVAAAGAAAAETGAPQFRNQLERLIHTARSLEEGGDLDGALDKWREVAQIQIDSPDLVKHIKELEAAVHDRSIERWIEQGHQLKRIRRYWSATKAYRTALRSMASDDPRAERLGAILRSTQRNHHIAMGIYGSAFAVIALIGALVAKPHVQLARIRSEAAELRPLIEGAANGAALTQVRDQIDGLDRTARALSGVPGLKAGQEVQELESQFSLQQTRLASRDLASIDKDLKAGQIAAAERGLKLFRATWPGEEFATQIDRRDSELNQLKRQFQTREQLLKEAPERAAAARAHEAAGRLAEALIAWRGLVDSPDAAVAPAAVEAVARLEARGRQVAAALERAEALAATDLEQAATALAGIQADATAWNQAERAAALRTAVESARQRATLAWTALGAAPDAAALSAFIAAHPAAAQKAQAQARLRTLQTQAESRDRDIAAHKALIEGRRWEQAWRSARALHAAHGPSLAGQVLLPLVVESQPAGATVLLDGRSVGTTPATVLVPVESRTGSLTLEAPGWERLVRPLDEAATDWRWQPALVRQVRWRLDLGKAIGFIAPAGRALHIAAGEVLVDADAAGQVRSRAALGAGDDLDPGRARLPHPPVAWGRAGWVLGLPGHGVEWLDLQGRSQGRWDTSGQVRGRPAVYTNDMLGPGGRAAVAADALYAGEPGREPVRIALPRAAMAGPLAIAKDLDRMLVVLTEDGALLGYEESTRRQLFASDLRCAEAGQLLPLGEDGMAVLLDGQRVAAWRLRPEGPQPRWTQPLPAPAVGDAVAAGNLILVAAGAQIVRISVDGGIQPAIPLPAAASCPPAVLGDRIAVGCGRMVAVFAGGRLAWTSPAPAEVTAVGFVDGVLAVGCKDGTVVAFAP
ncbi:MAG: hypothetical protein RLZZ127_154 [Planctomycetota bacterium]|jgi:hypothetical protein